MFAHIFTNRLKLLFRDRSDLFWTLLYPVILAVFYYMAFSNMYSGGGFERLKVAVVENEAIKSRPAVAAALEAASGGGPFEIEYVQPEKAEEMLISGEVKGYIVFGDGARVVVKGSGLEETMVKELADSVLQYSSAASTIAALGRGAALSAYRGDMSAYVREVAPAKTHADSVAVSFYGLISMAAMFGCYWGRREVEDVQADMTPQAMRLNLAPVRKLGAFLSSMCAAVLVQFTALAVLVAFMAAALGVNFGGQVWFIVLSCLCSSVLGVSFGAFVAALVRKSANLRFAVMLSVSLISASLAGMIMPDFKYLVTQAAPALAYVNPANLVSDAFYALYCYGANGRFFLNLALMLLFSAAFSAVVILVTRRRKYASL